MWKFRKKCWRRTRSSLSCAWPKKRRGVLDIVEEDEELAAVSEVFARAPGGAVRYRAVTPRGPYAAPAKAAYACPVRLLRLVKSY